MQAKIEIVRQNSLLYRAVAALSEVCDSAQATDGAGYNKIDAPFGHRLAEKPETVWTERERYAAWRMLEKYSTQLEALGIRYGDIEQPPKPVSSGPFKGAPKARLSDDQTNAVLAFAYNSDYIVKLRGFGPDGTATYNSETREWALKIGPYLAANGFLTWLIQKKFEITDALRERLSALESVSPKTIGADETGFLVRFEFNPELVAAVKDIPGARFDYSNVLDKLWRIPRLLDAGRVLQRFATLHGFVWNDAARQAFSQLEAERTVKLAASRAQDANLFVPGLARNPFPYQRAGIVYAAKAERTFIADEMGLGKTLQALGVIQYKDAYPALIVCPASLKLNWAREVLLSLPGRTVTIIDSEKKRFILTVNGQEHTILANELAAEIVIINYDILADGWEMEKVNGRACRLPRFTKYAAPLAALTFQAIVFDEFHYCKGPKSLRTQASRRLASNIPIRIGLTGTPILNEPSEILPQLEILGRLDELGGYWRLARDYMGLRQGNFGMEFEQMDAKDPRLIALNEKLRELCYIRREAKDVLTDLPELLPRAIVPLELSNRDEYQRAEREFIKWLVEQAQNEPEFLESLQGLSAEEIETAQVNRGIQTKIKAKKAEHLIKVAKLKQLILKGKLGAVKEWVANFIQSEKLIVFATHKIALDYLLKAFPEAARIIAEDDVTERDRNVQRFQADPACKLIICALGTSATNSPGGVGHTLTAAHNVAFVEVGWNPGVHDQAERRALRIGQVMPVRGWYLLAEGTMDMRTYGLVERKRVTVNAATEGANITLENQNVYLDLLKEYLSVGNLVLRT
jgi:SWI/SNF-related matrix-associated actin-dependent regulator of chromatin subfamily A-like protein 1